MDKDVVSWYKDLQASITKHFSGTRTPIFRPGRIASSNSLIRNFNLLIQRLQTARNILAVEMEAARVFQVTQETENEYPIMAIHGISHIIGLERDNQWTKYACQTAAAFTHAFVTADIITPRVTNEFASISSIAALSQPTDGTEPINVFISYSEKDEKFKKQLETYLTPLEREGIIHTWHSQQMSHGQSHREEIGNHIDSAQIILFLISADYLASDQLYDDEMRRAIHRQVSDSGDEVHLMPIIVRYIAPLGDLDTAPSLQLLSLPRNGKPIEAWRNPDDVWAMIAQEIRQVCKDLSESTNKY